MRSTVVFDSPGVSRFLEELFLLEFVLQSEEVGPVLFQLLFEFVEPLQVFACLNGICFFLVEPPQKIVSANMVRFYFQNVEESFLGGIEVPLFEQQLSQFEIDLVRPGRQLSGLLEPLNSFVDSPGLG